MEREGFILTRQFVYADSGQELVFWLNTSEGPLRLLYSNQESVFFIALKDLDQVAIAFSDLAGWRTSEVELKTFDHNRAIACYFSNQRILAEARTRLQNLGVRIFEGDVRPTDRFLMERFITGPVCARGELVSCNAFDQMVEPQLRTADFHPDLKIISLDIETSYTENVLYSIAVLGSDVHQVFMIGDRPGLDRPGLDRPGRALVYYCRDEKDALTRFLTWIFEEDPDLIIGWSVVNFDLRFLQDRCNALGIDFSLGRNGEVVEWRRAGINTQRQYVLVPGRVVLDGIELLRTATYKFESFSLEQVSRELLGRGKLIVDVDERASEIQDLFLSDKEALAAYNLEDCRLVWDIFDKTDLIDFAIARSRITGLELDRPGGSVAAFDFLYLPRLHRAGYVAPVVGAEIEGSPNPGGFVLDSQPGIYEDVIVLDFKSLYPSIIRTFHVDPLAMVEAHKVAGGQAEDNIPGFLGAEFSRSSFLLPAIIEDLWAERDLAKQRNNAPLSQAIKIIMNSFYGVLGTPGCRFFDGALVSSITMRGHEILQTTKSLIEESGFAVIYGDTDSVFVWLGGSRQNQAVDEICMRLVQEINEWWRHHLRQKFNLESCLEVEYETHYKKFFMPTVRGSDKGSKKRYAGLVSSADGGNEIVFKGLETVRSDWTQLAKEFQQQLYLRVFLDQEFDSYIRSTVQAVMDGVMDDRLVLKKRIRRPLSDYTKSTPPHVQAARKAERIRADKGLRSLYTSGGWIEYVMTVNGPEPKQYCSSPIDYQFYVDKQLAPVADAIIGFKGTSMKAITGKQLDLF